MKQTYHVYLAGRENPVTIQAEDHKVSSDKRILAFVTALETVAAFPASQVQAVVTDAALKSGNAPARSEAERPVGEGNLEKRESVSIESEGKVEKKETAISISKSP